MDNETLPDTPPANTYSDDKVLALIQAAKGAEWSEIDAAIFDLESARAEVAALKAANERLAKEIVDAKQERNRIAKECSAHGKGAERNAEVNALLAKDLSEARARLAEAEGNTDERDDELAALTAERDKLREIIRDLIEKLEEYHDDSTRGHDCTTCSTMKRAREAMKE